MATRLPVDTLGPNIASNIASTDQFPGWLLPSVAQPGGQVANLGPVNAAFAAPSVPPNPAPMPPAPAGGAPVAPAAPVPSAPMAPGVPAPNAGAVPASYLPALAAMLIGSKTQKSAKTKAAAAPSGTPPMDPGPPMARPDQAPVQPATTTPAAAPAAPAAPAGPPGTPEVSGWQSFFKDLGNDPQKMGFLLAMGSALTGRKSATGNAAGDITRAIMSGLGFAGLMGQAKAARETREQQIAAQQAALANDQTRIGIEQQRANTDAQRATEAAKNDAASLKLREQEVAQEGAYQQGQLGVARTNAATNQEQARNANINDQERNRIAAVSAGADAVQRLTAASVDAQDAKTRARAVDATFAKIQASSATAAQKMQAAIVAANARASSAHDKQMLGVAKIYADMSANATNKEDQTRFLGLAADAMREVSPVATGQTADASPATTPTSGSASAGSPQPTAPPQSVPPYAVLHRGPDGIVRRLLPGHDSTDPASWVEVR